MDSLPLVEDIASSLLAQRSLRLISLELLQPLWAGYGQICALTATPVHVDKADSSTMTKAEKTQTYVLKLIVPPPSSNDRNESHLRKVLSYQVEQKFYADFATGLPANVHVPKCLISVTKIQEQGSFTAMILSDLRRKFPVAGEKRAALNPTQVYAALKWLSSFHGFWWPRTKQIPDTTLVRPPLEEAIRQKDPSFAHNKRTLWQNGGYTYLATRQKEFESLARNRESEWSEILTGKQSHGQSISQVVATILSPSNTGAGSNEAYMTLLHGDVKSENLFTSKDGTEVAFYDFQYVGLGLGVCDLAKFFTCSVPCSMLLKDEVLGDRLGMAELEEKLLRRYLGNLEECSGREYSWDVFQKHWEAALVDWLRFQAGWGFWGNTEWLEARVRHILEKTRY